MPNVLPTPAHAPPHPHPHPCSQQRAAAPPVQPRVYRPARHLCTRADRIAGEPLAGGRAQRAGQAADPRGAAGGHCAAAGKLGCTRTCFVCPRRRQHRTQRMPTPAGLCLLATALPTQDSTARRSCNPSLSSWVCTTAPQRSRTPCIRVQAWWERFYFPRSNNYVWALHGALGAQGVCMLLAAPRAAQVLLAMRNGRSAAATAAQCTFTTTGTHLAAQRTAACSFILTSAAPRRQVP